MARIEVRGQQFDCAASKTRNRIRAYIRQSTHSQSREERLSKNLTLLYDRVSAGVHDDVDADEARAIVLNTYLLVGEIMTLQGSER